MATFGRTDQGGSEISFTNDLYGCRYTLTEDGEVASISAWMKRSVAGSDPNVKFALYEDPDGQSLPTNMRFIAETDPVVVTSTIGALYTAAFPAPLPRLAGNKDYYLVFIGERVTTDTVLIFYSDISANSVRELAFGFANIWPDPWTPDLGFVRDFSIYATYTALPPPSPALPPVDYPPGGSYNRALSGGQGGFLSYITPDGRTYPFHTPHEIGRWVVSFSGFGTPPIEYITERGPFQHGATVRDYFLRPRVIQLLIRQSFCDRVAWWGGRADLLNEIRPNRQLTPTAVEPGELQLVETDGTVRSLKVWIQEGPRFEPRESNQWDEWAFQEVLRFIAYDPVAFDPSEVTATFIIVVGADLVFPITFPITFGTGDIDDTLAITYPGTWLSFPIITIVGPIDNPRIDNNTTGEKLEFTMNVAVGRTVTIDLTEGEKTIVDDLGNNLIGTLSSDSDLGTFHLAPDPEAPLGVNTLRLRGANPTGGTTVALAYFDRYFGF